VYGSSASLLSPDDVAGCLAISVKSVYRLAASRSLGSVRVGGLLRFTPDELLAYIERNRATYAPKTSSLPPK
jgi:excisionase family DNA binding protein